VVSQKRMFTAAAGVLVAALALTGCGSDDVGLSAAESAALGGAAAPAAEDLVEASAAAQDPGADADLADPAADTKPAASKAKAKPVGIVTDKLISKAVPKMGNVVTDAKGWVLYRFDKDKADPSKSTCVGDCAILWPPVLADETLELTGLSPSKVDTVERADGGLQITVGGWPVYRYIGDKKPGAWKGQNVGGVWFVVEKDGKKNLTCLPKVSKPVPLPARAKNTAKNTAAKTETSLEATDEAAVAADTGYGGY
jgi:predicted lipoprotein with Yx(FWY)xxD motif